MECDTSSSRLKNDSLACYPKQLWIICPQNCEYPGRKSFGDQSNLFPLLPGSQHPAEMPENGRFLAFFSYFVASIDFRRARKVGPSSEQCFYPYPASACHHAAQNNFLFPENRVTPPYPPTPGQFSHDIVFTGGGGNKIQFRLMLFYM